MDFDHNYTSSAGPSYKKCCVPGCCEHSLRKFRFPIKQEVFHQWIFNIGNPRLVSLSMDHVYKTYRVCEKHFAPECISEVSTRGLVFGAVPTLFLPDRSEPPDTRAAVIITVNELGELQLSNVVLGDPPEPPVEDEVTEPVSVSQEPEPFKIREICKVCLQKRDLQHLEDMDATFAAFIRNFLEDFLDHDIPECYCTDCLEELKNIQQFMKKCKRSEEILQQINDEFGKINFYNSIQIEVPEKDSNDPDSAPIDVEDAEIAHSPPVLDDEAAPLEIRFRDVGVQADLPPEPPLPLTEKKKDTPKKPPPELDKLEPEECLCERCGQIDTRIEDHKLIYRDCATPIPCPKCDQSFKSFKLLTRHKATAHKPFLPCQLCTKLFKNKRSLKKHLKKHETGQFLCNMCNNAAYFTETELAEHKIEHKTCGFCGRRFKTHFHKKVHEKSHLRVSNPKRRREPVYCPVCKKKFIVKIELSEHLKVHETDGAFDCLSCKITFLCKDALMLHCETTHPETLVKIYTCELCGKRFRQQKTLNAHLNQHTDFAHVCPKCPKRFAEVSALQEHLVNDHDETATLKEILTEKQFICHVCGKGFCKPSTRRTHVAYKHGEEEIDVLDQHEREEAQ